MRIDNGQVIQDALQHLRRRGVGRGEAGTEDVRGHVVGHDDEIVGDGGQTLVVIEPAIDPWHPADVKRDNRILEPAGVQCRPRTPRYVRQPIARSDVARCDCVFGIHVDAVRVKQLDVGHDALSPRCLCAFVRTRVHCRRRPRTLR